MKKTQFMFLLMAMLLTVIVSCSKSNDYANINTTGTTTSYIITQGNWKVTYFTDNGADGTANFNGFKFSFTAGGSASASNDLFNVTGTWSTYNDDSQNKLLLNFDNTFPAISTLNHDWHIVEKTSIRIRMEDVSGGGGPTDYLTIEKI